MCCVDLVVISNKGMEETFWVLVEAFTMINPQGAIIRGAIIQVAIVWGLLQVGNFRVGNFPRGQLSGWQ